MIRTQKTPTQPRDQNEGMKKGMRLWS